MKIIFFMLLMYAWVWPIRRGSSCDIPLDPTARAVRWAVVVLGLAGSPLALPISAHPVGFVLRYTALAFFVWPNCGYHLTWVLRRLRMLPPGPPPTDPYIERMGFGGPVWKRPGD